MKGGGQVDESSWGGRRREGECGWAERRLEGKKKSKANVALMQHFWHLRTPEAQLFFPHPSCGNLCAQRERVTRDEATGRAEQVP